VDGGWSLGGTSISSAGLKKMLLGKQSTTTQE
jgi:hypothetical protein